MLSSFTLDGVIQISVDNPGHPYIFTVGKHLAVNDPCYPDSFWMGLPIDKCIDIQGHPFIFTVGRENEIFHCMYSMLSRR